jgi:hypothetical protein
VVDAVEAEKAGDARVRDLLNTYGKQGWELVSVRSLLLNTYGEQGWELVSVRSFGQYNTEVEFFFKRPLAEEKKE